LHCVDGILEGVGHRVGPFEYVQLVGEAAAVQMGVIGHYVLL